MEESKELQGFYQIFRAVVYVSVLMEFFEYAIDPATLDHWDGILCNIHGRIKQWMIYNDGNLVYSKLATILLICITCLGTRNNKHLECNARTQVVYPLVGGLSLLALSVWLFNHPMEIRLYTLPLNIIFYMATSLAGVILVHIALDNIPKFTKDGLMKDRFNFENESFEQCEELIETPYSVNIPMRYYYKGKFRKGWTNITNCFRGTWVSEHRDRVRHSALSSRLSDNIRPRDSQWWSMTTSSRRWPRNFITTTRRIRSSAKCLKGASST